jgi:hypothetical protein
MQTRPSPNMLRARMPPPPHLPEMFRLEEVLDFPAEEVHVVGVTKAAFNSAMTVPVILPASLENLHGVSCLGALLFLGQLVLSSAD